jgi:pimeloyl-ACP methyl ester carboxylesterase
VLVHAFGPRAWGWPLERLARDCTLVAIGRFEPTAPGRYVTEMDLVLAVMQRMGCQRFTLCPWSMAGISTIAYAATQAPELEKLVLVDVAGLGGPLRPRPAAETAPQSAAEYAKYRATRWVHEPGPVRDLVEALDLEALTRTPGAFDWILKDNQKVRETPPPLELEKIAVPTLVLTGRHSLVMGPDAAQRATRRLRDAEVVLFEQSAHALPLEEAEHFQNVVAEFVLGRSGAL